MAITMREVAARAGVSIATVSIVLNDSKPVTEATKTRVLDAVTALGYRRNLMARGLASRRSRLLAIAHPFGEVEYSTMRDFILGASQQATKREHNLVVWPAGSHADGLAALASQKLVDGVILMDVHMDDPRADLLRKLDIPFVLIGRTRNPEQNVHVDIDIDASVQISLEHLIGYGHTHIALINGSLGDPPGTGFGPFVRVDQTFRRLAQAYRIRSSVLNIDFGVDAAARIADHLQRVAPDATAALVTWESTAGSLMSTLIARGIRVPHDFSVMSLMGSRAFSSLWQPTLTTVTAPGSELGALGVEALIRVLNGERPGSSLHTGELFIGGSTRPVHFG